MKARKGITLSVAAVALAIGLASSVQARTSPLWLAKPVDPAQIACHGDWYHSITNNCSTVSEVEYPLVTEGTAYYTARVNAFGATPSSNVCCTVVSMTPDYGGVYAPARSCLPSFGSHQNISIASAYKADGWANFLACTVYPGGRIHVAEW
jgi:hypothetical protein